MLFSGMNACLSEVRCRNETSFQIWRGLIRHFQLPQGDREAMQAVIEANGGQFSFALTKRVTHLFVISPSGVRRLQLQSCAPLMLTCKAFIQLKYDAWLKHGRAHGIKCLLPHW